MLDFGLGLGLKAKIFRLGFGIDAQSLGQALALQFEALAFYLVALLTSLQ